MPFRAFGDVKFKWSIELQKGVLESGPDQLHDNEHTKFIPPNYHTPPYLTAEPEITHHKLRPQDRFLVGEEPVCLTWYHDYLTPDHPPLCSHRYWAQMDYGRPSTDRKWSVSWAST